MFNHSSESQRKLLNEVVSVQMAEWDTLSLGLTDKIRLISQLLHRVVKQEVDKRNAELERAGHKGRLDLKACLKNARQFLDVTLTLALARR